MKTAAFFDIDGTLVKGNAGLKIIRYLHSKKITKKIFTLKMMTAFLLHKIRLLQDRELIDKGAGFFKGKTKEEIRKLAEEAFEKAVKKDIYEEMTDKIKEHKRKKHKIILVTNEYDIIAEQFKRYIKADSMICSRLETIQGRYTGKLQGEACQGSVKGIMTKNLAKKQNIDLKKSYAYTDSIRDLSLLDVAGKPTAVNPDKELEKKAKKYNIRQIITDKVIG